MSLFSYFLVSLLKLILNYYFLNKLGDMIEMGTAGPAPVDGTPPKRHQSGKTSPNNSHRTYTYPEGAHPEDLLDDEEVQGTETHQHRRRHGSADDWEHEPVQRAEMAISAPGHREHIKEHLHEVLQAVKSMEDKSDELLEVHRNSSVFV